MLPDRDILQLMAKAAYSETAPSMIKGWTLVSKTPTLKFYKSGNTIVVAIRGTKPTDKRDIEADAKIALNQLETTPRYRTDLSTLLAFQKQYPPSQFEYYGVGHSLGGAILDAFIKDGWLRTGLSYNPAIQPKNLDAPIPNQRIYQSGDPLYQIFGRFSKDAEVRAPKKMSVYEQLTRKIPYVGSLFGLYKDHQLDNFEGGAAPKYELLADEYLLHPSQADELEGDAASILETMGFEASDEILRSIAEQYQTQNREPGGRGDYLGSTTSSRRRPKRGGATHREKVLRKYKLKEGQSLEDLSKATGVSLSTLQKVYNRGIGAYKTNPTSVRMKGTFKKGVTAPMSQKLSKEQWSMARVYSFLDQNPKHDVDLRGRVEDTCKGSGNTQRDVRSDLKEIGLSPAAYLRAVRRKAKASGYPSAGLRFAEDGVHKLELTEGDRTTKFGAVGYKDHLMWSHLEKSGDEPKGTAEAKRQRFQKSHRAMKGDWKADPMSANNLALRILW